LARSCGHKELALVGSASVTANPTTQLGSRRPQRIERIVGFGKRRTDVAKRLQSRRLGFSTPPFR
jgi:hypothetical protein